MFTVICPKCDKSFTKETETKANQALNFHNFRAHTRKGRGSPGRSTGPLRDLPLEPEQPLDKPKRKWTRKVKPIEQQVTINHCPCCGFNMAKLAMAMAVAERIK